MRGRSSYRRVHDAAGPRSSTWRLKKALALLLLLGGLSFLTATGTFAVLNSGLTNRGANIATGTLTFNNTVNSGTTCYSYGTGTSGNVNSSCASLASLSTSSAITSLPVAPLTATVTSSDSITVTSGSNSQTFTASATASTGATTISVNSATPNFAYPTGSTVTDTTHATSTTLGILYPGTTQTAKVVLKDDGSINVRDLEVYMPGCAQSSTPGAPTITNAADPCAYGAQFYIEETNSTGTAIECWYPTELTGACTPSDVTVNLAPSLATTAAITSLPVFPLTTAVTSGDVITLTSGAHNQTLAASANAAIGATSISITSATPNFAYPTGTAVADTTHAGSTTLTPQLSTASALTSLPVSALGGTIYAGDQVTVSSISTSYPLSSLPLTGLNGTINSGDGILVTSGSYNQTFAASASASSGASSVSVSPLTPTWGFASGATVIDTSSTLSTSGAITSIPVAALTANIVSGDTITLTSGANTQNFTASANVAIGATAIPVTSATPNFAYPEGATVADATHATTTTSALSTSGTTTTIPIAALSVNILAGNTITLTSGAHTQNFTASASVGSGSTSIPVNAATANFAYPSGSTATDSQHTTTLVPVSATLNSHSDTFTVSTTEISGATAIPVDSQTPSYAYPGDSFVADTTYTDTLGVFAQNLNAIGSPLDLGSGPTYGNSRYFVIGMRLPANASNTLQGQMAAFSLDWYISS
jgi:hypothetical protein